jgi:D-glycero-alpha-D-manno-heptose-7-phosphate kinase
MIISRTPFRMSFVGGGTDLPMFYKKSQGAVISTAINKYVYITVNHRFDHTIRVSYSQTEIVEKLSDLRHDRCREVMRRVGMDSGIEITSIADIPAGTGMGSSSSFTVGLFNALHGFCGRVQSASQLAEQACELEIGTLGSPIGKQDQYAAAFGGLHRYLFNPDGSVFVDPVLCSPGRQRSLFDHLMLLYVGGTRCASQVLGGVKSSEDDHLHRLRKLVDAFWDALTTEERDIRELGEILDCGWQCKKKMSGEISNLAIDDYYETARQAGALGGKLLGAGGTGFLLLFCEPKNRDAVRNSLNDLRQVEFGHSPEGSKIIYVGG